MHGARPSYTTRRFPGPSYTPPSPILLPYRSYARWLLFTFLLVTLLHFDRRLSLVRPTRVFTGALSPSPPPSALHLVVYSAFFFWQNFLYCLPPHQTICGLCRQLPMPREFLAGLVDRVFPEDCECLCVFSLCRIRPSQSIRFFRHPTPKLTVSRRLMI